MARERVQRWGGGGAGDCATGTLLSGRRNVVHGDVVDEEIKASLGGIFLEQVILLGLVIQILEHLRKEDVRVVGLGENDLVELAVDCLGTLAGMG